MKSIRTLSSTLLLAVCLAAPAFAAEEPVEFQINTLASAEQMTCYQIRTYCYNMWMIRRHNYPQYVGCVYSNAENNGLECSP